MPTEHHLREEQVRQLLSYDELIPAIRRALMDFSAGRVHQPVRAILPVPSHGGWFGVMPAVYGEVMGAKMVTFYPRNADLQKHTHMAVIQLFRADTGEPLATMDGRLITEMRTAAVSAVAIDYLAHPQAKVLGILGSGVQARSHMRALAGIRSFAEVRVWSRSQDHARQFADEVGAEVTTAEQAVWFSAPLFVILILCFSFAWGYYSLLLLPLGFVVLRRDRAVDWVVRLGVFLALAPPILVYTIPGYPSRYYAPNNFTIFHFGILLNGVSVLGVIITLAGVVMHSYDVDDVAPIEVPSAVQA